jgi:hypothetical protein
MMNTRSATLLLLSLILAGCSYRDYGRVPVITSFKDPAYAKATFKRIAIVADVRDLEWRRRLESQMVTTFGDWGISAVESYTIIPPTRVWSTQERGQAFASNGVDGYLSLGLDTTDMPERVVPLRSTTTTTRVKPPHEKGAGERETERSVTELRGGYSVRETTTRYMISLNDRRQGATAWIALNDMGGDRLARLVPFCEEVAVQLTRDGLVPVSADR